jgi:hypothetical protein
MTDIVTLYKTNFRDPVSTLREIANQIERGDRGQIGCIAMVIMGDTVEVLGIGPDSEVSSCAALLQAGNLRLVKMIERHGR